MHCLILPNHTSVGLPLPFFYSCNIAFARLFFPHNHMANLVKLSPFHNWEKMFLLPYLTFLELLYLLVSCMWSVADLQLASFIHPFTALTLIFCQFSDGIITPNSFIQMQFPLPTPCFNVALNGGVRASTISINIENGKLGKSLVIMPQWSNTFGPDCRHCQKPLFLVYSNNFWTLYCFKIHMWPNSS